MKGNRKKKKYKKVTRTKSLGKKENNKIKKRKLNKKKVIITFTLPFIVTLLIIKLTKHNNNVETFTEKTEKDVVTYSSINNTNEQDETQEKVKKHITDWKLTLANYENILPEDFSVEVANIDNTRQFDARAIGELNDMMDDMKKDGINNIWIQSAYRSVARQKELYDDSIKKYLNQGKSQQEAEELTNEYINKPGSSDHNLGLAVDFNYVDNKFEELQGFKWLQKNAENYGFILRYPKDKENITKIAYESWHWRYVGKEHAKKMNELNLCLEEYVEYLSDNN